jgi:dolichyl-phosphate beta-glucosyltransferase
MKTAIVIPCYNEATRLNAAAFRTFAATHPDYTLCFVNDGSTDETLAVLHHLREGLEERVVLVNCPINVGKAEAVRQGMLYLNERTTCEAIGFLDADLSTDFADFRQLVQQLANHSPLQMVLGVRVRQAGATISRNPKRHLIGRLVASLIRLLLNMPLHDTQCGAKLFRNDSVAYLFGQPFQSRWLFDVELLFRLKQRYGSMGAMQRLAELPLRRWVHVGDSKISARESLRIPMQLGKIASAYRLRPYLTSLKRAFITSWAESSQPEQAAIY